MQSGRIIKTKPGALLRWYAPYSGFLQHGTKHMAARPYLTIALAKVLKSRKLEKQAAKATKNTTKGKKPKKKQPKGSKRKIKVDRRKQRKTAKRRR